MFLFLADILPLCCEFQISAALCVALLEKWVCIQAYVYISFLMTVIFLNLYIVLLSQNVTPPTTVQWCKQVL